MRDVRKDDANAGKMRKNRKKDAEELIFPDCAVYFL